MDYSVFAMPDTTFDNPANSIFSRARFAYAGFDSSEISAPFDGKPGPAESCYSPQAFLFRESGADRVFLLADEGTFLD